MHPKSNTPNARRLKLSIQRQSLPAIFIGGGARGRQSEVKDFCTNPSSGTFIGGGARRRQSEVTAFCPNPSPQIFPPIRASVLSWWLALGGANPSSGTFMVVGARRRQSELWPLSRGGSLDHQLAKSVSPHTVGATPLLRQMVSQ